MSDEAELSDNIFKILLATDNHLGAHEKDPIRGEDSLNTFEEILEIAVEKDVDFVLLGGDLFDVSKPSSQCLHRCLALLRKYCMGDKPISVEFLSNQEVNFKHCSKPIVNYEDPNLNISIPVFSIHGNHDDPSGYGRKSVLDILAVSGMVNYFGKWTDLTQVTVSPLLLQKGSSKLAIYGLSHIKDERLSRLFRDNKVVFEEPEGGAAAWLNLLVLHQNRADRGLNKFIPESALPEFIDLVIWGHEHECRVEPEWNPGKEFYVTQPGSSVATSLCDGEAAPKHVALLLATGRKFKLEAIPLQTVRPFVFDTISLSQISMKKNTRRKELQNYVAEYVESMLEKADGLLTGHPKQPTLPLIRLRVEYTAEDETFNKIRFGQGYTDRVASATDMILFVRRATKAPKSEGKSLDPEALHKATLAQVESEDFITTVENYFDEADDTRQTKVLSVKGLAEAVNAFIIKGDKDALELLTNHQIKKTKDFLLQQDFDDSNISEQIEEFRKLRIMRQEQEVTEVKQVLESSDKSTYLGQSGISTIVMSDSDSGDEVGTKMSITSIGMEPPKRGRGRGRRATGGRTGASSTTTRGGRQKLQTSIADIFSKREAPKTPEKETKRRKVMYESDSD